MTAQASEAKADEGDPFAHVTAAGWGRGLNALIRIARLCFRHPWQAGTAIVSTFLAAGLQLTIPRLLGHAVDQSQQALAGRATDALWTTALLLFAVSVLRGLFTMVQNYYGESVGHHVGYELRLAFYGKIQRLSFGFHDKVHSGDLITIGMLDLEGGAHVLFHRHRPPRPAHRPHRRRRLAPRLRRPRPRPPLAQLRPLRHLALLLHAPQLARHLARAAAAPLRPHPRHGGEPRRHPRRPRLRRPGARDGEIRRRLEKRPLPQPPSRRPPRPQHQRHVRLLPRRHGPRPPRRRPQGCGRHDNSRNSHDFSHLHDHPADAGPPARPACQLLLPRLHLRQPHLRLPRPRHRDRRPPRRPAPRRNGRHAQLRERELRLRRPPRPPRRQLRGPPGRDDRHRRPPGQRQVHDRPPHSAILRRDPGPHRHRRPGRPRRHAAVPPPAGGGGRSGRLPLHHHAREQHRLRRPLGERKAHRAVERLRPAARLRPRPPRAVPHRGRRARRLPLRRPAPAPRHRPGADAQARRHGLRRLDGRHRRRHRAAHPPRLAHLQLLPGDGKVPA